MTARRFFPNFLNLDATYNQDPEWRADDPKRYIHEVATMGCRTRVFENRFGPRTSIGRGNLSFSTINIVKLAIECTNLTSTPFSIIGGITFNGLDLSNENRFLVIFGDLFWRVYNVLPMKNPQNFSLKILENLPQNSLKICTENSLKIRFEKV